MSLELSKAGCLVHSAASLAEALAILAGSSGICVAVISIDREHAWGADLANQIRNRWPAIRTILTTGASTDDSALEGLGAFACLRKPYTLGELLDAVSSAAGTGGGT